MGRMTYEKRQRERARRERKEARAARRDERRLNKEGSEEEIKTTDELMAQFQQLNRDHEAGKIELEDFTAQRDAIFEQLGVPM